MNVDERSPGLSTGSDMCLRCTCKKDSENEKGGKQIGSRVFRVLRYLSSLLLFATLEHAPCEEGSCSEDSASNPKPNGPCSPQGT